MRARKKKHGAERIAACAELLTVKPEAPMANPNICFDAPRTLALEIGCGKGSFACGMAAAHPDVNLIWGVAFDEKLEDEIRIVVIATNFDHESGFRIPTPPVDNEVPEDKITEVEPQAEQEPINDDLDISALIDMLNHDRDKRS